MADIPLQNMNPEQQLLFQDHDHDTGDDTEEQTPEYMAPRQRLFLDKLWNGPDQPRDEPPTRVHRLMALETLAQRLQHRVLKPLRVAALASYLLLWLGLVYSILVPYYTVPAHSKENEDVTVLLLSCGSSGTFWKGKNGACGLDGLRCPAVSDHEIIIRCPALCDRGSWTYSLAPVGDQRVKYRSYVIGGGHDVRKKNHMMQISNPYRADLYPCGAAVHAGTVSPFWGGCARMSYRLGGQLDFPSSEGFYGVGPLIDFDSFFPLSYFFLKLKGKYKEHFANCNDPRLLVLVVNIVLGTPIVLLASGAVTYWTLAVVGFWTIALATDPPVHVDALDPELYSHLLSVCLERFLPTCFILYVLWHVSVRRTFDVATNKDSPVTRLLLWYPLFWLGVLNNITFDRLPVDRLTLEDLRAQPGSIFAVGGIAITIVLCAFVQAYSIWRSGRFAKYITIYGGFSAGLFVLSHLPGLTLRVHHYILAMLLIPGCLTRGRTAIAFQGILLGLFLLGALRWGLAAIAETVTSLKRDDPLGKVHPPTIIGYDNSTGILEWAQNLSGSAHHKIQQKYSEVSLLVNDIESWVGESTLLNLTHLLETHHNISVPLKEALKELKGRLSIPVYLRLGQKIPNTDTYGDFTNAAVLHWPSKHFIPPTPGET